MTIFSAACLPTDTNSCFLTRQTINTISTQLTDKNDDNLFSSLLTNRHQQLLPDKTNYQYNLRNCHNLSSTVKTDARNFFVRQLFKYIISLILYYFLLFSVAVCQLFRVNEWMNEWIPVFHAHFLSVTFPRRYRHRLYEWMLWWVAGQFADKPTCSQSSHRLVNLPECLI